MNSRKAGRRWRATKSKVKSQKSKVKGRNDWSVIARAELTLHHARRHAAGQNLRRKHVVQPPADIPLLHVAPRRPPGKQLRIVGIHLTMDVNEAAADDAFDKRPLFRKLANRARLSLLGVN